VLNVLTACSISCVLVYTRVISVRHMLSSETIWCLCVVHPVSRSYPRVAHVVIYYDVVVMLPCVPCVCRVLVHVDMS
jgi:hypothetical protein